MPLVGEMPGRPGVVLCAGFSGHGMPQTLGCGAVAADIAAALLSDEPQSLAE